MNEYFSATDSVGRTLTLLEAPKRIVSVVPSQTELLYDLGLGEEVVGITKFCVHPNQWFRSKTRVGGTKSLHLDTIRALQPDLILANKEENIKEEIETLAAEFNVWTTDVSTVQEACAMIETVGHICGKSAQANELLSGISQGFEHLSAALTGQLLRTAAYLIWKDPLMTIGGDTYISDLMKHGGLTNLFIDKTRYPAIEISELTSCDLLLLSSEPYPFQQKHVQWFREALPGTTVLIVDGEYFSWYGSRLKEAPQYLLRLRQQIDSMT